MVNTLQVPDELVSAKFSTFNLDDPIRLGSLDRTGMMDSEAEPAFDRLVKLATRLLKAPVSLISLVDDHRQFFKAQCGLSDPRETPLTHSFCQYVVKRAKPLIVTDARQDPLLRDNLAIRDLNVIAYLGVPLFSPDGMPLGSFCAIDSQPRAWSNDEIEIMMDLAHAVQSEIRLRLALTRAEELSVQRDLLTKELNHRVKNLFAMVLGMIRMTARNSSCVRDMSESLQGRVTALSKAHALVEPAITGHRSQEKHADIRDIVQSVLAPHDREGFDGISGPKFNVDAENTARISMVLHELSTNASKYGGLSRPDGTLNVSWTLSPDTLALKWIEECEAIEKPTQNGFGSRLIENTLRQLHGTIDWNWCQNGLEICLSIPRSSIEA
jgi:two-component sensor histidine kinase